MGEGGDRLRLLGLAAMLVLVATVSARGAKPVICLRNPPPHSTTAGPIASPESAGLDGVRLCGIAARLKEMEADVHSVVIIRHGKLVFEQYYPGYDEPWGENGGPHEIRRRHQARPALGLQERGLAVGRDRDRPQADRQRRRAGREILFRLC